MRLIPAFFVALIITAPLFAEDSPATAAKKADRKICRMDTPTGSIMPKRTCHTEEEWHLIDSQNQSDVDSLHNKRTPQNGVSRGG